MCIAISVKTLANHDNFISMIMYIQLLPKYKRLFSWFLNFYSLMHSIMEKAMAPHSSTLAWKIPWTEEPGRLHAVHGVAKSQTRLSDFTFTFHFHVLEKEMGNPLQCSCLENPRDREAWWAAVYGVAPSRTRLKWLSSSIALYHESHLYFNCYREYCHTNKCIPIAMLQMPRPSILTYAQVWMPEKYNNQ